MKRKKKKRVACRDEKEMYMQGGTRRERIYTCSHNFFQKRQYFNFNLINKFKTCYAYQFGNKGRA